MHMKYKKTLQPSSIVAGKNVGKGLLKENNLYRNKGNVFEHIRPLHYAFPVILACSYKQLHGQIQSVLCSAVTE